MSDDKQMMMDLGVEIEIDERNNASLADLAEEYSVGRSTIHRIVNGTAPRDPEPTLTRRIDPLRRSKTRLSERGNGSRP